MNFVTYMDVAQRFQGKKVAIVGSGPSCLDNEIGFIDSHDIVIRVNNYKNDEFTGFRTDVYYSFFGVSIKKQKEELQDHGVTLCMCKLPNEDFIQSEWHVNNGKTHGIQFKAVYQRRKNFWFCDTHIPTKERLQAYMKSLKGHMPTTGFSCILDVLSFDCDIYITGFDFFTSGIHNVNEKWGKVNTRDPIRHRPDLELQWLRDNPSERLTFDEHLQNLL